MESALSFELSRRDWLACTWPGLVFYLGVTVGGVGFVLAIASVSWWLALLLVPVWWFSGRRTVGFFVFLARGPQRIDLAFAGPNVFASEDGGQTWAPLGDGPKLEDHGQQWLLYGGDGRRTVVVPKAALTEGQRSFLTASMRAVEGGNEPA